MSMASLLAELKLFLGTAEELNTLAVGFYSLLFFLVPLVILINWAMRHEATKLPFQRRRLSQPPGPPRLPVVGNLHQVGAMPHRSLQRLAAMYGPLMSLKMGQVPTLVVSSAAVAAEVLKTQDHLFCTRPPLSAVRSIFYGGKDVAFTPYNAYWRQMRRVCTQELFTSRRVELFRRLREEEVATLVGSIRRAGAPVNMSDMLLCLLNNITCREVFGQRFPAAEGSCGRSRMHELVTEWTTLMGHFNVGEYFPSMEWINVLTGLRGRFRRCFRDMDTFLDAVIDTHQRQRSNPHKEDDDKDDLRHEYLISVLLRCLEDSSLDIPITREHVKAVLMVCVSPCGFSRLFQIFRLRIVVVPFNMCAQARSVM
ncbi:hypothetical protein Taro_015888 [Colocasia esculenta]|uniref:Uncharacterized protein n=1 Tax=Colocasia esculenta TaxID=4460 RepID=A0A843UJ58_COLES|nr:hypothetical protein [Colocasia esculenta]